MKKDCIRYRFKIAANVWWLGDVWEFNPPKPNRITKL